MSIKTTQISKTGGSARPENPALATATPVSKVHEQHSASLASLLAELEQVRSAALDEGGKQLAIAVNATMGKARLLGLDKQTLNASYEIAWGESNG